jgi:hypothetical protein
MQLSVHSPSKAGFQQRMGSFSKMNCHVVAHAQRLTNAVIARPTGSRKKALLRCLTNTVSISDPARALTQIVALKMALLHFVKFIGLNLRMEQSTLSYLLV